MERNRKAHWAYQMRRVLQPKFPLRKPPPHAEKVPAFQQREIAVNERRARVGCSGCEVALLEENNPQAAARGIARNARTVKSAADDRQIVIRHATVWGREAGSLSLACASGSMTLALSRPAQIGPTWSDARDREILTRRPRPRII